MDVSASASLEDRDVPLVVDLDGTLVRTDTLVEAFLHLLATRPFAAMRAVFALRGGKAALKARVAELSPIEAETLPLNADVLTFLQSEKAKARRIYLATAADRRHAAAIADHLGLFDGVFASEGGVNLSGKAKAAALTEAFGQQGFDYIGDAMVDLPVWGEAKRAFVANARPAVERAVRRNFAEWRIVAGRESGSLAMVRALRPHQWLKNLLIFVPLIAAHQAGIAALQAVLAFLSFSLCASGAYLLNDLLDLRGDRRHPRKKLRPFAAGTLGPTQGAAMVPLLLGGAFALALTLPMKFALVLALYMVLTTGYSLYVKRLAMIDVTVLACLYGARIMAGAAATGIDISPWLLVFSLFFFFSLALIKRCTELIGRRAASAGDPPGRAYQLDDLPLLEMMAAASAYVSVLVLALYVNSAAVTALYRKPHFLWAGCIVLMFWMSRTLLMTHRDQMHDDPVVFAVTDRVSLLCGLVLAGLVAISL